MPSSMKQWTCPECGESGIERGAQAARTAHMEHYAECHNDVPF